MEAPIAEPPTVFLVAERDVLAEGQLPVVSLYIDTDDDASFRPFTDFELRGPSPESVSRTCGEALQSGWSGRYGMLDFACQRPASEGLFSITLNPEKIGLKGSPSEVPLRVLKHVPTPAPPPNGWVAFPLAAGAPETCYSYHHGEDPLYDLRVEGDEIRIKPYLEMKPVPLPQALALRVPPDHAQGVTAVLEEPDGWIVTIDHGEWGGGIEWYEKAGGPPQSITIQTPGGTRIPQNVGRAVTIDGTLFMLQGLAHLGISEGQLSSLWREHGHFTTRVIARYESMPRDWLPQPDGSWLVVTDQAIWKTHRTSPLELVVRLPEVEGYGTRLQIDDGKFYLTGTYGILRLTPTWAEQPRYLADMLFPKGSARDRCWSQWTREQTQNEATQQL